MTQSFRAFVPVLAGMIPFVVVTVFVRWEQKRRSQWIQSPQPEKLLRAPGHSLRVKMDRVVDGTMMKFLISLALCWGSGVFFEGAAECPGHWRMALALISLILGVGGAYSTVLFIRDCRSIRNLRLGLRGEQAVADALQEVADCGYRSFHDFPGGDNWNIDHIAVGPSGIFLVETKARNRAQPRWGQRQRAHVVHVVENRLQFPTGRDLNAIPQAERNAKWLANYLTKKTGENVEVSPLLVLPGWYVEVKTPTLNGTIVMNTNYLTKYLRGRPERLRESQLRRIAAALEEKCRDVEF